MTPDKSALLESWLHYTPVKHKLHPDGSQVSFNMVSRGNVVDAVDRHLSVTEEPDVQCSNSPTTAAAETANVFVDQAINQNMGIDELKCEANALCLALFVTVMVAKEQISNNPIADELSPDYLLEFVSAFSTLVSNQYVQDIKSRQADCDQKPDISAPPPRPETLQHALRSPLQGAILFLDLMREDIQTGEVSIEDVDSVISSLNHIVRLLDESRDRQN